MIGTKLCTKCGKEKQLGDFYANKRSKDGRQSECKDCNSTRHKKYYLKHIDQYRETHAKYHLNNYEKNRARALAYENSERGKQKRKEYYESHKEEIREYHKQYREKNINRIRARQRAYYHANKDKVAMWKKKYEDSHKEQLSAADKRYRQEHKKELNGKHVERLHNDPVFKLKEQLRCNIRDAFKRRGRNKTCKTAEIVGCGLDFLCDYLFKTWESNYGRPWNGEQYHIDHIVPLATAKTEEDVIRLCHYTNLQLLKPEDNMDKSDHI